MTDPIARINDLRQRVLAGEDLTPEEVKESTALLRARRKAATSTTDTKGEKSVPLNLNELFTTVPGKDEKK